MFCYKCGQKLNDNAAFCHKCGTRVQTVGDPISVQENGTPKHSMHSSDLDHEALKIYLGDLLTLECIKNKFKAKLNDVDRRISFTEQPYKKTYVIEGDENWSDSPHALYFMYKKGHHYIAMQNLALEYHPVIRYYGANADALSNQSGYFYISIEEHYDELMDISMWRQSGITYTDGFFAKRAKGDKAKAAFLRCYEDFKNNAVAGLQIKVNEVTRIKKYRSGIVGELNEVEKMLSKAYGVNVIPSQFRNNLYAIYYLHDFISTSNQSLATAMLHFDLNEIKVKLDKIIAQQQEMIIQQSILMAQNQQKMEQNQLHLKMLANIESKTERAATYSAIAASNAEACAWIGLANYLK